MDFERFDEGLMKFCGPTAVKMWPETKLQGKVTLQEVELQLSQEEHDAVVQGGGVLAQSSLSTFLFSGIQIEEAHFISKAIKLFMPSELDSDTQRASICGPGIAEAKICVREAEARDLLQWLCQRLRNQSTSHLFTVKNENELQILNKEDVRAVNEKSLTEEELHDQERLRDLGLLDSTLESTAGGSWSIAQLALCIEWCKACARMLPWEEEVKLLNEKMRRVLAYKEWHHGWWMSQLGMRMGISEDLQEGLMDQSHASELEIKWHPLRKLVIELLEGLPITEVYEYEIEEDNISDDITEEE
ncbi:hypothetical protein ARMGADRAFT_1037662 [Armillaria gallica]|uniref:Uncharacterized protein n=1 Tax=Armillaria gallica TaxID=47427 RepID=A0A2H3CP66_ARMGA|nr:hypothetical protein ARMGADRAFT_1037662 [Armillaria gallica]